MRDDIFGHIVKKKRRRLAPGRLIASMVVGNYIITFFLKIMQYILYKCVYMYMLVHPYVNTSKSLTVCFSLFSLSRVDRVFLVVRHSVRFSNKTKLGKPSITSSKVC